MTSLVSGRSRVQDPTMKVEAPPQLMSALAQTYDALVRIADQLQGVESRITGLAHGEPRTAFPTHVLAFARRNLELAQLVEASVASIDSVIGSSDEGEQAAGTAAYIQPEHPGVDLATRVLDQLRSWGFDTDHAGITAVSAAELRVGDWVVYHGEPVQIKNSYSVGTSTATSFQDSRAMVSVNFSMGASATYAKGDEVIKIVGLDRVINASMEDGL